MIFSSTPGAANDPNLPEPCSDECEWCGENIPADERMPQAVFGIVTDSTLDTREICDALIALLATELQKAWHEGHEQGYDSGRYYQDDNEPETLETRSLEANPYRTGGASL